MIKIQQVSRRSFIKNVSLASGGLLLSCNFPSKNDENEQKSNDDSVFEPNLFVHLKTSGELILIASRSEMGQGVRTSITSIIADEMDADWTKVSVEQAIGHPKYGNQNTDGSRSVRTLFETMRKMGATAKAMLVTAAANKWQADVANLKTSAHYVINTKTNKKIFYGDLAADASLLPIPENPPLKKYSEFTLIGKGLKSVDINDFTSGKAIYGMDIKLPGMKYAVMARCPVTFGIVKSFDKSAAMAIKGVEDVFEIKRVKKPFGTLGGIVVVATNTWAAIEGKKALKIEWDYGDNKVYNSDDYMKTITANVHRKGKEIKNDGNVNSAFNNASQIVESTYKLPHLVHAPMEVPNATAWIKENGACEVWTPTQAPQVSRDYAAEILEIDKENITINVTLLGGAFGRKSKPDFVVEAVLIAKEIKTPVQLVWTREDDIQNGYYHAVSAQYMKGSLDKNGKVTGWLHRVAYPSITSTFAPDTGYAAGFEFAMGMTNIPYQIKNIRCENGKAPAYVRIGWYRSVYNIIQGFSVNVFVDELAAKAGKDPLQFRLDLIGEDRVEEHESGYNFDSSKMKNVLKKVANNASYGKDLPKGHGIGIGLHYSFFTYVASIVEVSVIDGKLKTHSIHTVIDCGTAINTNTIKAQLEGAAIFAMSLAYYGKITAKDGAIEQSNYHNYKMLGINQTPNIHIEIIESTDKPTGVGEPGVPPITPAIINAIYNATGKRYYSLPLMDYGLV